MCENPFLTIHVVRATEEDKNRQANWIFKFLESI